MIYSPVRQWRGGDVPAKHHHLTLSLSLPSSDDGPLLQKNKRRRQNTFSNFPRIEGGHEELITKRVSLSPFCHIIQYTITAIKERSPSQRRQRSVAQIGFVLQKMCIFQEPAEAAAAATLQLMVAGAIKSLTTHNL